MRNTRNTIARNGPPLPVRPNPELRVHLVLRDHLACEDMAHEEIVVHRVSDNPGDGGRIEFDETVVLRLAGLRDAIR